MRRFLTRAPGLIIVAAIALPFALKAAKPLAKKIATGLKKLGSDLTDYLEEASQEPHHTTRVSSEDNPDTAETPPKAKQGAPRSSRPSATRKRKVSPQGPSRPPRSEPDPPVDDPA